ncbi:MAG: hypothetical protein U5N86_01895 [Planctomycetota bacterium]|nr:hypothetical protein [Planctomycetota bacterium]
MTASDDVWAKLASGYTVHCAKLEIEPSEDGKSAKARLSSDKYLERCRIAGENFVATESSGLIIYENGRYLHTGRDIELVFDVEPSSELLPPDLEKEKLEKLTVSAERFSLNPSLQLFRFENAEVSFGPAKMSGPVLEVRTNEDLSAPKSVECSGTGRSRITYQAMSLASDSLSASFTDEGKLGAFTAIGSCEIMAVNSEDSSIAAKCESVTYEPGLITLLPKEGEQVHMASEIEGWSGVASKVEFMRKGDRWDHRAYNATITKE